MIAGIRITVQRAADLTHSLLCTGGCPSAVGTSVAADRAAAFIIPGMGCGLLDHCLTAAVYFRMGFCGGYPGFLAGMLVRSLLPVGLAAQFADSSRGTGRCSSAVGASVAALRAFAVLPFMGFLPYSHNSAAVIILCMAVCILLPDRFTSMVIRILLAVGLSAYLADSFLGTGGFTAGAGFGLLDAADCAGAGMGIVVVLCPAAICMFGKYRFDRDITGRHSKSIIIQCNIAGHSFPFYKVAALRRGCGQCNGLPHGC